MRRALRRLMSAVRREGGQLVLGGGPSRLLCASSSPAAPTTQKGIALDIDPLMRHAVSRQELSSLWDARRRSVTKQIDGEGGRHCVREPIERVSVAPISPDSPPKLHEVPPVSHDRNRRPYNTT